MIDQQRTPSTSRDIHSKTVDKHHKIAIIGAGVSGLTIARALSRRGFTRVVVYEKKDEVGGRIQSIRWCGRVYETGALVANHNFKHVLATARDFHETLTRAPYANLVDVDGRIVSYRRFIRQYIGWPTFLLSAARLLEMAHYGSDLKKPGFAHVDPSFYAPMAEFAKAKHFTSAAQMIQPFLIGCGYGYYEQVPAMYLMKLAPWVLGQPFLDEVTFGHSRRWSTFDRGWQDLMRHMADGLDVRLGTTVESVKRRPEMGSGGVTIVAGGFTETFDKLIVTTLPSDSLRFLDASRDETRFFQVVRYVRYVVTLVRGTRLRTVHFLPHIAPETIGHVNCIVRQHDDTDIYQLYQMLPEPMTLAQALTMAHHDLHLIGGAITDVIAQREWRYFPHVCTADLERDFYKDLERMQGEQHTYYAGSLLNFDTVEHNAAYAEALVKRFF
jgi:protoporphyrinogen/coproporphyrinogen III oxidase